MSRVPKENREWTGCPEMTVRREMTEKTPVLHHRLPCASTVLLVTWDRRAHRDDRVLEEWPALPVWTACRVATVSQGSRERWDRRESRDAKVGRDLRATEAPTPNSK